MTLLLLVADDLMVSSRIELVAKHLGYELLSVRTPAAFEAGVERDPQLILLGTHATRLDWVALLQSLKARASAPPVLVFGPHADAETRRRAREAGATRWIANSRLAEALPSIIEAMISGAPVASELED